MKEQEKVVAEVLFSFATQRLTGFCNEFLRLGFGFGSARAAKLREVLDRFADEAAVDRLRPHGNVGRKPWNATPQVMVEILERALDRRMRPNPSGSKYIGTGGDVGLRAYLRAVIQDAKRTDAELLDSIRKAGGKELPGLQTVGRLAYKKIANDGSAAGHA